jgi:hypothetical protein
MNEKTIEYYLIAARKDETNNAFVTSVMQKVTGHETLAAHLPNAKRRHTKRRLPAFAVIAIAVGIVALLSGTSYAAYKLLWQKPEVHNAAPITKTTGGRSNVSLSLSGCDPKDIKTQYVVKHGATITDADVPMVVQAHCELDAIGTWAKSTFPYSSEETAPPIGQAYDQTRLNTSMATHIASRDDKTIVFTGLTKYNEKDTSFTPSDDVQFIADGHQVKASDISSDDPVVYVTGQKSHMVPSAGCNQQHCSYGGTSDAPILLAVVKLDLPFQYYDQLAWQSLAEVDTCQGNSQDTCLMGYIGGVDIYITNRIMQNNETMKTIQGVVTTLTNSSATIKTSSGRIFTINTPGSFGTYNTTKAARYYNNQYVKVGSSLSVMYVEATGSQNLTIESSQIIETQMMLEGIGKSDPVKAY